MRALTHISSQHTRSAYHPLHSETERALLRVMNDLFISDDEGSGVILVLLDLSDAIDNTVHNLLRDYLCQ